MAKQTNPKPRKEDNEPKPIVDDLPQEITESYGTGVHPEPGMNLGKGHNLRDEMKQYNATSPELTGGDVDADWEQAHMSGEEAVGGTAATPDQSIVDELGVAVGLEMADNELLHTEEILNSRDANRWELEPESSDDFAVRDIE